VDDFFLIAKIVSVVGKDGFLKILSYSDFPERFFSLDKVFIDFFGEKKLFLVEKVTSRSPKSGIFLKFKGFDTEKDARVLVGKNVFVDRNNLVKLPEGYFFIHDLIGSRVFRNEKKFGVLRDVLVYPSNDVYVIEDTGGNEVLIPAVKDYIESFDPVKKILILKPGSGIYEDEN
jgi:16S rRNA processing protein RimM